MAMKNDTLISVVDGNAKILGISAGTGNLLKEHLTFLVMYYSISGNC